MLRFVEEKIPFRFNNKNLHVIFFSAIPLFTFLLYLPSLWNGFINWDDNVLIYENPGIRSIDAGMLRSIFSPELNPTLLPLTLFTYALDYSIWGLDPFGFHLTNLAIHCVNTALVFALALKIADRTASGNINTSIAGLVAAVLFGMHPLNAEAVNWLTGRSDLLSASFFLSALFSYIIYVERREAVFYVLGLLLFLTALLSKPTSVSLPAVLLLLDFYIFRRKPAKDLFIEKLPFFILGILSVVVTLLYRQKVGVYEGVTGYPMGIRLLIVSRSFMFYLYKALFPFNLAPYYPYPGEIEASGLEYAGSLTLLMLITVLCIRALKKNALSPAAWLCYGITLFPMVAPLMGFYKIGGYSEADRYAYIALTGPFFLAGLAAGRVIGFSGRRFMAAVIGIMSILVVILGIRTIRQTVLWRDSTTLWSHEIRLFPEAVLLAYNNRGLAYFDAGDYPRALEDYNKAIALNPAYTDAYNNRGALLSAVGDYRQAEADFSRAIELNPGYAKAYYNRGLLFNETGNYPQAIEDFARANRLQPTAEAYYNSGNSYRNIGNDRQALEMYNMAIGLDPLKEEAYNNRGSIYIKMGNFQQAVKDLGRAMELKPAYAEAYNNRGAAYYNLNDLDMAEKDFKSAVSANPQYGSAYLNLGLLYMSKGDRAEAVANLKKAAGLGVKQAREYLTERGIEW